MKSKESYAKKRQDGRYQRLLDARTERYKTDEVYRAHIKAYNNARYAKKLKSAQMLAQISLVVA